MRLIQIISTFTAISILSATSLDVRELRLCDWCNMQPKDEMLHFHNEYPTGSIVFGLESGQIKQILFDAEKIAGSELTTNDIRDIMDAASHEIVDKLLKSVEQPNLRHLCDAVRQKVISASAAKFLLFYSPCSMYLLQSVSTKLNGLAVLFKDFLETMETVGEEELETIFNLFRIGISDHSKEYEAEYSHLWFIPHGKYELANEGSSERSAVNVINGNVHLIERYRMINGICDVMEETSLYKQYISKDLNNPKNIRHELFTLPKSLISKYIDLVAISGYMQYTNARPCQREAFLKTFPPPISKRLRTHNPFTLTSLILIANMDQLARASQFERFIIMLRNQKVEVIQRIMVHISTNSPMRGYLSEELNNPEDFESALKQSNKIQLYEAMVDISNCINSSQGKAKRKNFFDSFSQKHHWIRDKCKTMPNLATDALKLMALHMSTEDLYTYSATFNAMGLECSETRSAARSTKSKPKGKLNPATVVNRTTLASEPADCTGNAITIDSSVELKKNYRADEPRLNATNPADTPGSASSQAQVHRAEELLPTTAEPCGVTPSSSTAEPITDGEPCQDPEELYPDTDEEKFCFVTHPGLSTIS